MPRKPGIFKLHQQEILKLLNKNIWYTEIVEIFYDKYGIKVTKQNLEQSHKRYLKEQSNKTREKGHPKRADKSHKQVANNVPQAVTEKYPAEALESIFNTPESVAKTLALRERLPSIQLELESLLDAEANRGLFSDTQLDLLRGWAKALFTQDPDTALVVFRGAFGSDFLAYMHAFDDALKRIYSEGLHRAFETRARPASEEILLMDLRKERKRRARLKRERIITRALQHKKDYPDLYAGFEINFKEASKESSVVPKN